MPTRFQVDTSPFEAAWERSHVISVPDYITQRTMVMNDLAPTMYDNVPHVEAASSYIDIR